MNILVINAGSSSLKYQLINLENHEVLAKGICERVGTPEAFLKYSSSNGEEVIIEVPMNDHNAAMEQVIDVLINSQDRAINSLDEVDAIGHRIVQGGKYFEKSVLIDDDVVSKIDELAELAPLHNKAALMGIEACKQTMSEKPMVAVFDSSYFQTLSPKAYMYPIPYELYEKHAIRKYGAHGTSHKYVAERAADFLGKPLKSLKIITCHLGNGCSMSAIEGGIAIDTSMGLTPLDGLMMGTRSGAIDPTVVTFVADRENLSPDEVNNLLNKQSGLLGISGVSNDMRSVCDAAKNGNERAQLAFDMYVFSIKKYLGQYLALMGGADAIVLTAGIGENSNIVRKAVFEGMEPLGIILDPEKNDLRGGEREISSSDSEIKILVIPTDEEYAIARDTYDIVSSLK